MEKLTTIQLLTNIKTWVLGKIQNITALIPGAASAQNQLADKKFVEDSIPIKGVQVNGSDLTPDANKKVNVTVPDVSQFITKTVDDLVNYYLKSETYTKAEVNSLIAAINQFHYEVYPSLASITSPASNVLYLIGPTGSGSDKYEEYVYSNSTFVKIGDTSIDLSGYVTTTALNTALATKVNISDIVDNLTTNDATKPLSAKQGKVLDEKVSQLGQKVEPLETLLVGVEKNIIGELVTGYYNTSGHPVDSAAGYKRSGYIIVTPGETINVHLTVTSGIVSSVVFFDNAKNPIVSSIIGTIDSIESGYEITVPDDAYYLGVSTQIEIQFSSVLATRNVADVYTKPQVNALLSNKVDKVVGKGLSTNDFLNSDLEKVQKVPELLPLEGLLVSQEKNIISSWVDGFWRLSDGSFVEGSSTDYKATAPIPVIPGETVTAYLGVTSSQVASVAMFNRQGAVILADCIGTMSSVDSGQAITIPQDVYYIAFSTNSSYLSKALAVRKALNAYTKQEVDGIVSETEQGLQDQITELKEATAENENIDTPIPLTMHTVEGTNGYWAASGGGWASDNTRRGSEKIQVQAGETYLITTRIGGSTAIGYLVTWKGATYNGVPDGFTGGSGNAVDKPYTIPEGVTEIAICSYNTTEPTLKKRTTTLVSKSYSKEESDNKFALKESVNGASKVFGVRWSLNDINDEGERCFAAVGLNAVIGIGTTNGSSDFDSIFPWSEMKRCNIKTNANGAKIVTFEGEDGFALDGSNGDVFVRIPKFKTNRYADNGKMYITIGEGYVHPAFIENGVELDEIFVGAFEASISSGALYSKGGVIPANNMTNIAFLAAAKARGANYTLFDMRSVDAIWRLMAVEYGKRNSNRILGWGYADFWQPVDINSMRASVAASQSNTITLGKPSNNDTRQQALACFKPGNNICICDETQGNIVAQRKVTSVQCASINDYLVISFAGEPIDISLTMFVGNAPCDCNYCETIENGYQLNWHTGRANITPSYVGINIAAYNPCRYRWIENPIGNVWHNLPDVRFNALQMYVCPNMLQYDFEAFTNYKAVGGVLPEQFDNGNKTDVNTVAEPNYWITALMNDVFAKGNGFAKSFDTVHDGTLTSQKGYGGYYYLKSGSNIGIVHGGGYDHLWRCNMLTFRAWLDVASKWYLYGARLLFKNI